MKYELAQLTGISLYLAEIPENPGFFSYDSSSPVKN